MSTIITQENIDAIRHLINAYQAGNDESEYNPLIMAGIDSYDYNEMLKHEAPALDVLVDRALAGLLGQELSIVDEAYFFEQVVKPYWKAGNACYDEVADLLYLLVYLMVGKNG